ncbi:MAG: hypothetical protein GF408_04835 [Candidatus Omnitrophica bacterium]|nr:hypothetical protein [Candidatus Omnitrophota bacterium]
MLKKYRSCIDNSLKTLLKEAAEKHNLSSPSGILFSGIKDFLLRKGKRIRPLLYIAGYKGYIGKKKYSEKDLVRSSLAFELLHDFLLIHDDVIDKADLRRGKPALHKYFNKRLGLSASSDIGASLGIVAGDIVFALAIDALGALEAPARKKERAMSKFLRAAVSTGTGEYIDVVNNITPLDRVSRKDVLNVYSLKTAEYTFEAPLTIGAMMAGAPEKEVSKLSRIGMLTGRAFQVQDDLLDLFASSKVIGKPVLSDLDESKKTLPVWKAYSILDKKHRTQLRRIFKKDKKTLADLKKVRSMIRTAGADKYCLDMTSSLLKEADGIFRELKMKHGYKNMLKEFIDNFFAKTELLYEIIGPAPRG